MVGIDTTARRTAWTMDRAPRELPTRRASPRSGRGAAVLWILFVVAGLLLMDVLDATVFGVLVPAAAVALGLATARVRRLRIPERPRSVDIRDLIVIAALWLGVVGLYRLAFVGFTSDHVVGLFLAFGGGLVLGVVGPVVYSVWLRGRSLASLGLTGRRWRSTLVLGVLFAAVQFSITLWGYDLPRAVDWVPLLVMALTVGLFEAVFFRGFVQGRLEASFGAGTAVVGAAALYALYHVGYGMEASELVFLLGLGVVYAIAYRLTESFLVLWPLLTPLGALFAQLESADLAGELPWASIAGFGDVLAVMVAVILVARRHERRRIVDRR